VTESPAILLRVEPAIGEDADDLDDLAAQLRQHAPVIAPGDGPPQKFDAETLIAALGSAGAITAVVAIVQAYLQRNRGRKATIEFKGQKLKLDGYNGTEIERILHELQSKH
jgi:hypothetical protein